MVVVALGLPVVASAAPTNKAQALLKRADVVARKTARMRGLKLNRPIKRGVMNRAQLKARLLKRVAQEYSQQEVAVEELLLKRFALLKESDRYLDMVIALLTQEIAGFYDPWEKQLYIAGWMAGGDMLLAHEILHALQDQHFDLRRFMKVDKHETDAMSARQALVEGDGTALMLEFSLAGFKQKPPWGDASIMALMRKQLSAASSTGAMAKAPLFLREGMMFPYVAGLDFVAHFRRTHPWRRIDRIFRKPPLSTEQILHPRKYERFERPHKIRAAELPALGEHKLRHHNVNGEHGLALLLEQHGVHKEKAKRAAAGWGGDRIALYAKGKPARSSETVGVLYSTWDDEADAREFADAVHDILPALSGATGRLKIGSADASWGANKTVAAVERRGDQVVLVVGVARAKTRSVLDEAFARYRVRRR